MVATRYEMPPPPPVATPCLTNNQVGQALRKMFKTGVLVEVSNFKGTFFVRGGVCYSYGDHYPICRVVCQGVVEGMCNQNVSKTTNRHISIAIFIVL